MYLVILVTLDVCSSCRTDRNILNLRCEVAPLHCPLRFATLTRLRRPRDVSADRKRFNQLNQPQRPGNPMKRLGSQLTGEAEHGREIPEAGLLFWQSMG